jgi:Ca-activated chloride channel homolog
MRQFDNPIAFLLLLLVPIVLWVLRCRAKSAVRFSSKKFFEDCKPAVRVRLMPILTLLRIACIVLIVLSIARPREGIRLSNISTDGVAMQIVLDRSGSMAETLAYDGRQITRFDAAKLILEDFIKGDGKNFEGRYGDMLGLITFARFPDTVCPLVHNHGILLDFLRQSDIERIRQEDGTAIGEALALAAARLKTAEEQISKDNARQLAGKENEKPDFEIKSKVIVLLTDGINNAGDTSPMQAAELAKQWGIKVYTIGIGSESHRTFGGMRLPLAPEIDERMLTAIADTTGGFYARADSADALKSIYERIDKLEKTHIEAVDYYEFTEKFEVFTFAAVAMLLLEILFSCTILRKVP